jgi:hypothetical protein
MKIRYKQPYWIKFKWDISENPDDQYVTHFNKHTNDEFTNFLHNKSFVISSTFKIGKKFERDEVSMVYGKPGKQIGLSYNTETQTAAFEYWVTTNYGKDEFRYFYLKGVNGNDIENGVTITIVRDNNILIAYKNFEEINRMKMAGEFVEDYKIPELFLGCASPQSQEKKHRYHCEVDYDFFSILKNKIDIKQIKELHESKNEKLVSKDYYDDILCLYDFQTTNNIGIIYDESKNTNFLERVPSEFVL